MVASRKRPRSSLRPQARKRPRSSLRPQARKRPRSSLRPQADAKMEREMNKLKLYVEQEKKPWLVMARYHKDIDARRRGLFAYLPSLNKFIPFPLASCVKKSLLGREGKYEQVVDCFPAHRLDPRISYDMVMASSGDWVFCVVYEKPYDPEQEEGLPRSLVWFNPLTGQSAREPLPPGTDPISISILRVPAHGDDCSPHKCRLLVALMCQRGLFPRCEIFDIQARTWQRYVSKEWDHFNDIYHYRENWWTWEESLASDPYAGKMVKWKLGSQDLGDADLFLYVWQGFEDNSWELMGYNVGTDSWMKARVSPPTKYFTDVTHYYQYEDDPNLAGYFVVWKWKGKVLLATSFRPTKSSERVPPNFAFKAPATSTGFDVWELKAHKKKEKKKYIWDHISQTPPELWHLPRENFRRHGLQPDVFFSTSTSGNLVCMSAADLKPDKQPLGNYAPPLVYDVELNEWSQLPQAEPPSRYMCGLVPLFVYEPNPEAKLG